MVSGHGRRGSSSRWASRPPPLAGAPRVAGTVLAEVVSREQRRRGSRGRGPLRAAGRMGPPSARRAVPGGATLPAGTPGGQCSRRRRHDEQVQAGPSRKARTAAAIWGEWWWCR
jgi:hypothetical protein